MAHPQDLPELDTSPAADIKTKGWPSLVRKVQARGAVAVTRHNHAEVVIVEAGKYRELVSQARAASGGESRRQSLAELQQAFDQHLATLASGDGLARVIGKPAHRGGKIRLGKPR